MTTTTIFRMTVPEASRAKFVADLFGLHFPMKIEPMMFSTAAWLSPMYAGGLWTFYSLTSQGFYAAPDSLQRFAVSCSNGYEGEMSADALGITACLYAFSLLSFSDERALAEACTRHYHLLRDYAMEHTEVLAILAAID
jgi:hypothetical protein